MMKHYLMGRWMESLASSAKVDTVGSGSVAWNAGGTADMGSGRSDERTTEVAAGSGEEVAGPRKQHFKVLL